MSRWLPPIAVLVLASGCPSPRVPSQAIQHSGPAVQVSSPQELLKKVQQVNDGYGTLKSVHKVALEIALGGDRSEKRTIRGALAIYRPGLFRLQILGPMGILLADLLYRSGKVKVVEVSDALKRSSRLPEILESIAGDLRAIYRLDPLPRYDNRKMEQTVSLASGATLPLYSLKEYRRGEIVRQLDIFASSLAIARTELVNEEGDVRTITYGDFRTDGKVVVPQRIHVAKEGKIFYWLSIEAESTTLDEDLDEDLFVVD